MVTTLGIGQSAGKIPKPDMLRHGIPPTTARVSVLEIMANLHDGLKIQSSPYPKGGVRYEYSQESS